MYELFVALHMPVAVLFVAMLFWHCNNYLTSWSYLWATVAIWLSCYVARLFKLNWTYPWRMSWLIGDEAAVTLLAEDAVRVTIPTEVRWKPGQFVYLRIPAISVFENHPFTIASLCSDDFPSEYGERYRDLVLVFKPFGGFTRKVLNKALAKGPMHTYRAFLDGPYGGMQRSLDSFDNVVLIAGGSGITALVSHVLDLVKRMRDGKATTKKVQIIWAVKRLEAMEWFKEELRICREYAPPGSVECLFFVTAAKRQTLLDPGAGHKGHHRPISGIFGSEKINEVAQVIASKRSSALVRDAAGWNVGKGQGGQRESEDGISALPMRPTSQQQRQSLVPPPPSFPAAAAAPATGPIQRPKAAHTKQKSRPSLDLSAVSNFNRPGSANATTTATNITPTIPSGTGSGIGLGTGTGTGAGTGATVAAASVARPPRASFDFGFPSTPTLFQKNLMRFAFGVSGVTRARDGWSMQYGRPDLGYMLKDFARDFGTRSCVFVCGPPDMRNDVARAVAQLQREVLRDPAREEIHLHYEDFAL
jgi:predicted ferric reductase